MTQNPLIKEFHYPVSVNQVWQTLTSKEYMKEWYFSQLQSFEPVAGYTFGFDDEGATYRKEWVVTKVEKGKTLAHSWACNGYPGISEVIFDLFAEENSTCLRVTQTGLESFPDDLHFKRERFERGWDNLLGHNLKRLLESSDPS